VEALATELVCVLRYRRHYYTATGINKEAIAAEFLQHAHEEQEHADLIAERINQLGGKPNFNPEGLAQRSHSEYSEPDELIEMIRENLVAERIAIDSYTEMIRFFGDKDPTSRRVLEQILAVEGRAAGEHVIERVSGERERQRGFAAAVGAHERVNGAGLDGQVDPLEDLLAFDAGAQILDL